MVQVIENRADVEGRILSVRDDPTRPGHKIATIDVVATSPVESFPNLFEKAAGSQLELVIPEAAIAAATSGRMVKCRIRRAGPAIVFAERCDPIG